METHDPEVIRKLVLARLDDLPPELLPVRQAAARYLDFRCSIGTKGNEWAAIAHSPWLGVLSHAIRIYPAIKATALAKYEKLSGIKIPAIWRPVLLSVNGLEAFGLNLFGIPASMLNDPPLLNRSIIQCLDISLAQAWKYEYKVDPSYFHVGARDYSYDELVGYFITGKGTILGVRQNGKRVGEWPRLDDLLSEELQAAEKLFLADAPEDWKQKPK